MQSQRIVQGVSVPSFFYGTAWKEDRTAEAVRSALACGFRAIDTANQRRHYVEADVGMAVAEALNAHDLSRKAVFLQTKFTYRAGQDHRVPYDENAPLSEQVEQSFASSLDHLRTSYVDSYLLHGPSVARGLSPADWQVWHAMEALHDAGKARLLGVSNVSLGQLVALCEQARIPPAFVQNRCFARTGWDRAVRSYCASHDIAYQGFSLLTANAAYLNLPPVQQAARRTGASPAQVVFAFALAVGMIPLTGTTSRAHMVEDLATLALQLSDADTHAIEGMAT